MRKQLLHAFWKKEVLSGQLKNPQYFSFPFIKTPMPLFLIEWTFFFKKNGIKHLLFHQKILKKLILDSPDLEVFGSKPWTYETQLTLNPPFIFLRFYNRHFFSFQGVFSCLNGKYLNATIGNRIIFEAQ